MTGRIHPMHRSERRVAWVIQVLVVIGILVVLVGDLLGGGATDQPATDGTAAQTDVSDPAGSTATTAIDAAARELVRPETAQSMASVETQARDVCQTPLYL